MYKKAGFKTIRRQSAVAVSVALTSGLAFAGYEASTTGAMDDTADLGGASSISINVLANDTDVDTTTLSVTTQPSQGTAVLETDGTITYTVTDPDSWTGSDSFTYTISDLTDGTESTDPVEYTLTDVAGEAPSFTSYTDSAGNVVPVYEGGISTLISNGADLTDTVPAYFNELTTTAAGIDNGVVAKTYYPNTTATSITGCEANDTEATPLSVKVLWNGERHSGSGDLQYFISKAEEPTDSGDDLGAIEYRTSTDSNLNAATTNSGDISYEGSLWKFTTNAEFTDLTAAEFESMPISILASTYTNKTWYNNGVEFVVTFDPSACSTTTTATVTISGTIDSDSTDTGTDTDSDDDSDSGGGGGALTALLALLLGTSGLRKLSRRRG
ncbi:Ig-like domain-containing protein [Granulosicoccaceae sp. 1_MG-2023]|nr:Ig-like domain-containing protein [Granulosicoccaceae sp. 1_MG-2023]